MKRFLIGLLLGICMLSSAFAEHFLTFIIPCYNCEKWIEEAVGSIYQQQLNCPFEIICTDDGSSDQTYEVLLKLEQKYPELSVYQHPENLGGSHARNTCVQNSHGDIIFCLDSDNILVPNSVQKLIDHMDKTGHDVVAFGALQYFVDKEKNGQIIRKKTGYAPFQTARNTYRLKDLFRDSNTPPWSGNYLYTRESFDRVGGYPPGLTIDTFAFGFLQVYHLCKMSYVPNTFYWHREGIDSYYIRASREHRINLDFFHLLLQYEHVFTYKSLKRIKEELKYFKKTKEWNSDVIAFLENELIKVNKKYQTGPYGY